MKYEKQPMEYPNEQQRSVKKKNGQGHKPVIPLRFSKSGTPEIERWYATHSVDTKRVSQLKAEALNLVEDGISRQDHD